MAVPTLVWHFKDVCGTVAFVSVCTLVWYFKGVCGIVSFVSVCTLVWHSAHVCTLGRLTKRARRAALPSSMTGRRTLKIRLTTRQI